MQEENSQAIDFEALVEMYASEESAKMMLGLFDQSIIADQTLFKLLDAVLYADFVGIKGEAHKLKGSASYAQANTLANLSEIVQNAGRDHDLEIAKTKLTEIIREAKRVHIRALELMDTPQEEIDVKIKELYDILLVYSGDSQAEGHIENDKLIEHYGDEDMAKFMLENGIVGTLGQENFIGLLYTCMVTCDNKTLERHAHSMKGRAKILYLPKLIEACANLQSSAKKSESSEVQFKYFIGVLDESIYMERYINIKKLQGGEQSEKALQLSPEVVEIMQNRDNIPEMVTKLVIKDANKINSQTNNSDVPKNEGEDKNSNREESNHSTPKNNNEEAKSNHDGSPESEKNKIHQNDHKSANNSFHDNSNKTVLETIPEEKEKEESKNFEPTEEIRGSKGPMEYNASQNLVVPEAQSKQKVEMISPRAIEDPKVEDSDSHASKLGRPRSLIHQDLEEIKENKEESLDSPPNIVRSSQRRKTEDKDEMEKQIENKKEGIIHNDNIRIKVDAFSRKRKTIKEEQIYDDDYPFDSGLKCNIY